MYELDQIVLLWKHCRGDAGVTDSVNGGDNDGGLLGFKNVISGANNRCMAIRGWFMLLSNLQVMVGVLCEVS